MNFNIHGYTYKTGDIAWVLTEQLQYRSGICSSVDGVVDGVMTYHFLMDDNHQEESYTQHDLYPLKSYAEIQKNLLVTPTPTLSPSPTPSVTRTPYQTPPTSPTPSPSYVTKPNLLDTGTASWSTTNGTVEILNPTSLKLISSSSTVIPQFSIILDVIPQQIYKLRMDINQGSCNNLILKIDTDYDATLASQNYNLFSLISIQNNIITQNMHDSSRFDVNLQTKNSTKIKITISLTKDASYSSAAKSNTYLTLANLQMVSIYPYLPVVTPTPSPVSVTPYTVQFDSTGIVEVDADSGSTVDWGDGVIETIPGNKTFLLHTYASVGSYIVKVYGDSSYTSVYEQDETIPPSNSKILSFGTYNVENISSPLSVYAVPNQIPATLTDLSYMFSSTTVFNQDISSWNTSNVTNMAGVFNSTEAFNQDISSWNTSNVTNMAGMFGGTTAFNQNIGSWNTSNVANMSQMFAGATAFNGDISGWNTSNVTNMSQMVSGATMFNKNISSWNTSNVTDMSFMFSGATTFNQDISSWNTSNVTNMVGMFVTALAFNQDISSWNTSKVTDMNRMFNDTTTFNQNLDSWNTINITSMSQMFAGATAFNGDISSWNTSKVTDMSNMFNSASTFNQNISSWDTKNVSVMNSMFNNATAFNQDLSHWCVTLNMGIPSNFDTNATAWTLPRPVWGTCPT